MPAEKRNLYNNMEKIRIGIVGYGNVGKGAIKAVNAAPDMELGGIFTRRDPALLETDGCDFAVFPVSAAEKMTGDIDVMLLCGGSATDLPEQGPYYASLFNTVDSYDNHTDILNYMEAIGAAAKNTTAIMAAGWDPGLFSIMRIFSESILPDGASYTFWGKGVSQGHSDAIRHIEGVRHAVQYTIPVGSAVDAVRSGTRPELSVRDKHLRECFVVAQPGADKASIEESIKSMPHYFADYDTTVSFIETDEFMAKHSSMPHGGMALRSGNTGENTHVMELSLKLDSNPEFTGSILAVYARAAFRMSGEGLFGVKTVFDVPPSYLSEKDRRSLIKELL